LPPLQQLPPRCPPGAADASDSHWTIESRLGTPPRVNDLAVDNDARCRHHAIAHDLADILDLLQLHGDAEVGGGLGD